MKTAYGTDQFNRWVWDEDGYTMALTPDHADAYMQELAVSDRSRAHKANAQKSLKRASNGSTRARRWGVGTRRARFPHRAPQPRENYLLVDERTQIREAALAYGSISAYLGQEIEQVDPQGIVTLGKGSTIWTLQEPGIPTTKRGRFG